MFQRLPTEWVTLIFQWLSLQELLAVRGCSRGLRERHDPQRPLWKILRPNDARLKLQLCTSLPSAMLMQSAYTFTSKEIRAWGVLLSACENDRLAVAQWLTDRFGLTAEDARANDNYTLCSTCENGHLAVAQWLAVRFGLTAEDARATDNAALQAACENGHLAIAQWLVGRFEFTAEDARDDDNQALRFACSNGHLTVAQWLADRFELTAEDARADNNFALRASCVCGHREVAQLRSG